MTGAMNPGAPPQVDGRNYLIPVDVELKPGA
jgi:hypothetical protein